MTDKQYPEFGYCRVADLGDAWVPALFELIQSHNALQDTFERVVENNIVPLSVEGDHSVTLPIFRALAKNCPVGMLHIDANCDTGNDYMGLKFHQVEWLSNSWVGTTGRHLYKKVR